MSRTQNATNSGSFAAAFSSSSSTTPVKKLIQEQQQNNSNNDRATTTTSPTSCVCDETGSCCSNNNISAASSSVAVSKYATFTQDISGPTFVPVFASVQDILPHHNDSAKGQVPWKCARCPPNAAEAFGHKCPSCGRSRDTSALRVFMGQLSKEGDVELITKMLEVLCASNNNNGGSAFSTTRNLLHIEPHTHAGSGRGKGCAWVYVSSLQDVHYLVERLHKRTYPTVNAQTGEVGFVAFPDSYSEADIRRAFDNDASFLNQAVQQLFHRSPITCEVPLTLQRSLEMMSMANNQQQQQNHHFFAAPAFSSSSSSVPPQYFPQQQEQQQQEQVQQQQVVLPSSQDKKKISNKKLLSDVKPVFFRSFVMSPSSEDMKNQQQQSLFPAIAQVEIEKQVAQEKEEIMNNNDNENVVSLSRSSSGSEKRRYRWNPYSNSSVRVSVQH